MFPVDIRLISSVCVYEASVRVFKCVIEQSLLMCIRHRLRAFYLVLIAFCMLIWYIYSFCSWFGLYHDGKLPNIFNQFNWLHFKYFIFFICLHM